ncbi:ankyrin [Stipitochalara longipes BDJ]|nr:ankyrin [Stipitochalara longipes BDJ]
MIDPFSLATGLAGLISLTIELTRTTCEVVGSVKNSGQNVANLQSELNALRTVMNQLCIFFKTSNGIESFAETAALVETHHFCKTRLEKMILKLQHFRDGGKFARGFRALTWPLNEKETREIAQDLHRCAQTFSLSLTVEGCNLLSKTSKDVLVVVQDQAETLAETQKITGIVNDLLSNTVIQFQDAANLLAKLSNQSNTISNISQDLNTVLDFHRDDQHDAILKWLSTVDVSQGFQAALQKHQEGTGEWLLEKSEFRDWKFTSGGWLWILGSSGCGKTILSSVIIKNLQETMIVNEPKLVYFFFDFRDAVTQSVESLFRSLVQQLSTERVLPAVQDIYDRSERGKRSPNFHELKKTLQNILQTLSSVYIVIDALDECTQRDLLFQSLLEMKQWGLRSLRIITTSRTDAFVYEEDLLLDSPRIYISKKATENDIHTYVEQRLIENQRLKKWARDKDTRDLIKKVLTQRADGMFRWVACQLERLQKCLTRRNLVSTLNSLPETLQETYERMLFQIDRQHRSLASAMLTWLTFSLRPLTIRELVEAIALSSHLGESELGFEYDEYRLSDPNDIALICPGLIQVRKPFENCNSSEAYGSLENRSLNVYHYGSEHEATGYSDLDEVSLAHFSVKEYLTSSYLPELLSNGYHLKEADSHVLIAYACLRYLLIHLNEEKCSLTSLNSTYPLAQYAARFWINHTKIADEFKQCESLLPLCRQVLSPQSWVYNRWLQIYDPDLPGLLIAGDQDELNLIDGKVPLKYPLYYMAQAGINSVTQMLINEDPDGVGVGLASWGIEGSPLQTAAFRGHIDIVRLLLDNGADLNDSEALSSTPMSPQAYMSPLCAACDKGHTEIVRLLVERGAYFGPGNPFAIHKPSALYLAALQGHNEIVALLVDKGASCKVLNRRWTPIHAAASEGHAGIVRLFLSKEPDAVHLNGPGGTILSAAIAAYSKESVEVILEYGADVEELDKKAYSIHKDPGNALCQAAALGDIQILGLLLKYGADVNAESGTIGCPLKASLELGHLKIAQKLLQHGAAPNVSAGISNSSALSLAAGHGFTELVTTLISSGADVARDIFALAAAAKSGHAPICRILIEAGASIDAISKHGTALQAAAYSGEVEVAKLLLDRGASIIAGKWVRREGHGNAFEAALVSGNSEIYQLFLSRDERLAEMARVSGYG